LELSAQIVYWQFCFLESLEARLDELSADSPEKRFVVVKLHRDSTSGIGIKLAGSSSGGVFIASLLAGGSAEQDGTLQIGDQIVAINGISTEGISDQNVDIIIVVLFLSLISSFIFSINS